MLFRIDRIAYKSFATNSKLILLDEGVSFEQEDELKENLKKYYPGSEMNRPLLLRLTTEYLMNTTPSDSAISYVSNLRIPNFNYQERLERTKMVIFTSGTTGDPKGVKLPIRAYDANARSFESFLLPCENTSTSVFNKYCVTFVLVNPFHHTNSTAMFDWALRLPSAVVHVIQTYTTPYWKVLADACEENFKTSAVKLKESRIIAPLVSRHVDFLACLYESAIGSESGEFIKNSLTIQRLRDCISPENVVLLLGSSPVGPTTVETLKKVFPTANNGLGKLPVVRFGSTETCLQVLGIPFFKLGPEKVLRLMKEGWDHVDPTSGDKSTGYYIGRPHQPYNDVCIIRNLNSHVNGQKLQLSGEGVGGWVITRGENLMSGYVNTNKSPFIVDDEGVKWYTNLGDVGFYMDNVAEDGGRDFFWQSRDAGLVIKGGANYSSEQIAADVKSALLESLVGVFEENSPLDSGALMSACMGVKVKSEHEDESWLILEIADELKRRIENYLLADVDKNLSSGDMNTVLGSAICKRVQTFMKNAGKRFNKGSIPDEIFVDEIPRNFKGVVDMPKIIKYFEARLQTIKNRRRL